MWPFSEKQVAQEIEQQEKPYPFLTHMGKQSAKRAVDAYLDRLADTQPKSSALAMDSSGDSAGNGVKDAYSSAVPNYPDALTGWFASQGFIGHQLAAMLAQHWLIDKACYVPARDAIRHGFKIEFEGLKSDDESTLENEIVKAITKANKRYRLNHQMKQFVHFGRVFGIRVALFEVDSDDADYYIKPYNPDGVTKGSYKGIRQIDPYWCMPQLDSDALNDPASASFYEPTFWQIKGTRYHRSHLCIFRNSDVPDVLKPSYLYGGVPVPQRIMERVYAAERTANEAPLLAMSKRLMVWNTDMQGILANQKGFLEHMAAFAEYRDNYGTKLVQKDDVVQQFDTALADVDTVTMSQYQLVAAAANIPVTKLLGTTPKGFNATGEYDEASYHEELESIQTNDLQLLVERHHELLLRSEIAPKFHLNAEDHEIIIDWEALDSPTAKEYAEINEINSRTDANLVNAGAIDGMDVRDRLTKDPNSGYAGLPIVEQEEEMPQPPEEQITTAGGASG